MIEIPEIQDKIEQHRIDVDGLAMELYYIQKYGKGWYYWWIKHVWEMLFND